jgi:pyrimidine-nucleoside phosphorylase
MSTNNPSFSAYQILEKKRDAKKLTSDEIKWFIDGLTSGDIPDYQVSALLMAIYTQGMDREETAALADAMLYSGKILDFKDPCAIEKHSTGGVGDKASFILAPMAASCGVKVPMIAGRGLGHTGGTIDKIEAIAGIKTDISLEHFQSLVREVGLAIIGQTKEIAPADGIIYALRDVTATVPSIPLITASIMSKKLASGTNGMVFDIKTGNGAFMKNKTEARKLAKSLMDTGLRFNKSSYALLTNMSEPLGRAVGNSLEIIESIETLKGNGPKDLTDLCIELSACMIHLAGKAKSLPQARKMTKKSLEDGSALEFFRKLIEAQGGDGGVIDSPQKLPLASCQTDICDSHQLFPSQKQQKRGLLKVCKSY